MAHMIYLRLILFKGYNLYHINNILDILTPRAQRFFPFHSSLFLCSNGLTVASSFWSVIVASYLRFLVNSPGTEIFPFSYFAFTLLQLRKVIKDIKNINICDKTRTHGLDFGRESFYRNHYMTPQ